jgi:hypothetical protein
MTNIFIVGSGVLTAVVMKISIFWDMARYSLLVANVTVYFEPTAGRYIPEDTALEYLYC